MMMALLGDMFPLSPGLSDIQRFLKESWVLFPTSLPSSVASSRAHFSEALPFAQGGDPLANARERLFSHARNRQGYMEIFSVPERFPFFHRCGILSPCIHDKDVLVSRDRADSPWSACMTLAAGMFSSRWFAHPWWEPS